MSRGSYYVDLKALMKDIQSMKGSEEVKQGKGDPEREEGNLKGGPSQGGGRRSIQGVTIAMRWVI